MAEAVARACEATFVAEQRVRGSQSPEATRRAT